MKSKVFILSFTLLLIFGQIVFGQEKGVGNQTVSKLPAKEKRWAVIIGVSKYEDDNITPLPGAANDARALRDALHDYAGFDEKQIILLTTDESKDRQPTKNNILRYLGNLSGTVPKDGLLLVAFSGHGIERQKQAFLLASDTPYNDNLKVLERTAISVSNDFKELIRDTAVGQVIILLDACRNDPSSGRSSSDNPLTQAYKDGFSFDVRNREVEAFATLYATSIGERAYEYTHENKGYFTWAFIEGLKGGAANENGEVTLGALIRYVEKYVPQQVKIDLGSNKIQRPFSIVEGYKAEELILGISKNINNQSKKPPQPKTDNSLSDKEMSETSYWNYVKQSNDLELLENYLLKYPKGIFAESAKSKLKYLLNKTIDSVAAAVVRIEVKKNVASVKGSGVMTSEDGLIVTSHDLVDRAKTIVITTTNGNNFPAKIVGTDAISGIAVIKIEGVNMKSTPLNSFNLMMTSHTVFVIDKNNRDFFRSEAGVRLENNKDQFNDLVDTNLTGEISLGSGLFDTGGRLMGIYTKVNSKSVTRTFLFVSTVLNVVEQLIKDGRVTKR